MSLSDSDNDQFKPMALSSLESFNKERSNNTDKSKPNFDRFELLFEESKFEKEKFHEFEAMYDVKKEPEEIIFKPLIEPRYEPDESREKPENHEAPIEQEPEKPEETPDEKGYRQGFEKGLEQGMEQGQKKGYEEAFKKGETEGLEKGEQQGIEQGEKKGFEQGLKEGEEKATKETRKKAVEILNSLEDSLKTADSTLELLVEKYEERIISLIQLIAQKAVMVEIEINDEIVKAMVLDALKMLVKPEEVVLSVSSDDYEYIEMVKDEFFEQIDSLNSVSVRSDPSIKRGGCKIETLTASISADPESRLEALFEAIKNAGVE
ncbi:MAG: hypothetical protein KAQ72_12185 [Desulfobacula sp.]|nr:hypothetical protein [Desulfobacula sp.]